MLDLGESDESEEDNDSVPKQIDPSQNCDKEKVLHRGGC